MSGKLLLLLLLLGYLYACLSTIVITIPFLPPRTWTYVSGEGDRAVLCSIDILNATTASPCFYLMLDRNTLVWSLTSQFFWNSSKPVTEYSVPPALTLSGNATLVGTPQNYWLFEQSNETAPWELVKKLDSNVIAAALDGDNLFYCMPLGTGAQTIAFYFAQRQNGTWQVPGTQVSSVDVPSPARIVLSLNGFYALTATGPSSEGQLTVSHIQAFDIRDWTTRVAFPIPNVVILGAAISSKYLVFHYFTNNNTASINETHSWYAYNFTNPQSSLQHDCDYPQVDPRARLALLASSNIPLYGDRVFIFEVDENFRLGGRLYQHFDGNFVSPDGWWAAFATYSSSNFSDFSFYNLSSPDPYFAISGYLTDEDLFLSSTVVTPNSINSYIEPMMIPVSCQICETKPTCGKFGCTNQTLCQITQINCTTPVPEPSPASSPTPTPTDFASPSPAVQINPGPDPIPAPVPGRSCFANLPVPPGFTCMDGVWVTNITIQMSDWTFGGGSYLFNGSVSVGNKFQLNNQSSVLVGGDLVVGSTGTVVVGQAAQTNFSVNGDMVVHGSIQIQAGSSITPVKVSGCVQLEGKVTVNVSADNSLDNQLVLDSSCINMTSSASLEVTGFSSSCYSKQLVVAKSGLMLVTIPVQNLECDHILVPIIIGSVCGAVVLVIAIGAIIFMVQKHYEKQIFLEVQSTM